MRRQFSSSCAEYAVGIGIAFFALSCAPPLGAFQSATDEPTGNLDSANSALAMAILIDIQKKLRMTLIVTHENEIAAARRQISTSGSSARINLSTSRMAMYIAIGFLLCSISDRCWVWRLKKRR